MKTEKQHMRKDNVQLGKIIKFPNAFIGGHEKWEAIDLTKDSKDTDERIKDAFKWAFHCVASREIMVCDPRRKDFEHLMEVVFNQLLQNRTAADVESEIGEGIITRHNLKLVYEEYHEMWFQLWHEGDFNEELAKLVNRVESLNSVFFKFVSDETLQAEGMDSIDEYMKANNMSVTVYDTTLSKICEYEKTYCTKPGWLLMSAYEYMEFPPVDILKSLTILVALGIIWSEEKLDECMDWAYATDPAITFSNEDQYIVTRYEPSWQEGRVDASPAEDEKNDEV